VPSIENEKKNDKQDQQGQAAFNESNPIRPSNKNQWKGAQVGPKQKQDRAQDSTDRLTTKTTICYRQAIQRKQIND
jgi:hypothetical protein